MGTLSESSEIIPVVSEYDKDDIEEYHARVVREVIKDVYGGIKFEPRAEE